MGFRPQRNGNREMSEAKWQIPKKQARADAPNIILRTSDSRLRSLSNSIVDLETEAEVVHEVSKLWREAQEKFLTIGRYLVRAKRRFAGNYERVILPQLPFGRQVAFQLRTVAAAVDGGKIEEEVLPRSYSTAYTLVTLETEHLQLARSRNLVRPDVARSEIEAFRREILRTSGPQRFAALERERQHVARELERLHRRIAEIDDELSKASRPGPIATIPRP
jgi:hypothetical protein